MTVSIAAKHNGGRSQVNPSGMGQSGQYQFINRMLNSTFWGAGSGATVPYTPDLMDTNGYPTSLLGAGASAAAVTILEIESNSEYSGIWVITWTGNGTMFLNFSQTPSAGFTSANLTGSSGSGRYEFTTSAGGLIEIGITALPITNLKFFRKDEETNLNNGEIFSAQFKSRLIQANFGVIRFLNWNGETGLVSTWSTRKPQTYFSYTAAELRNSIYAGATTNSGTALTSGIPSIHSSDGSVWVNGDAPKDKDTILVLLNSAQTAPTLKVGSSGTAIATLDQTMGSLSSNSSALASAFYDATLNSWIVDQNNNGLRNEVPYEVCVQLCAELGAHPYFPMPRLAVDPITDLPSSLASYVKTNGPSWMIPRFEGPNETWNFGAFPYAYASAKATAYAAAFPASWAAGDYHNWYGKVISVLGQAISAIYSNDRTKYQVLCGVQTVYGNSTGNTTTHNPRMTSASYVAQNSPQLGYTATAGSGWVTHICCAQYVRPSAMDDNGGAQELALATSFANGDLSAPGVFVDTLNSGNGYACLANIAVCNVNWKAWAQGFGVQKMCGYEGGYSPDYGGATQIEINLRYAGKSASALASYTMANYQNFVGLTDGTFTAEFPSCFQLGGPLPTNTVWSVLEDIFQTPDPPQWVAICAFNSPKRASNRLRLHG